jgi:hypothetical protein
MSEQIDYPIELGSGRIDNLDFNGDSGDNNLFLRFGSFENQRKFAYRVSLEKLTPLIKGYSFEKRRVDDFTFVRKTTNGIIVSRENEREDGIARMSYFTREEADFMKKLIKN